MILTSNIIILNYQKKQIKVWLAALWGALPDIFSFTAPFMWLLFNFTSWNFSLSDIPRPEETEPAPPDTLPIFRLTSVLYSISHSAIVFFVIFGLAYFVVRKPLWEMGGWFLHILIDIPTHSYQFYPTPFLWPVSEFKFNGFSWGVPWFLILNYSVIIIVYFLLRKRKTPQ